jgi:hypothetical protein
MGSIATEVLRSLGFGKDPHVDWMIEAFAAKPGEVVVNDLYQHAPRLRRWRGEAGGVPVTFYTDGAHGSRGAGGLFLGTAGPQFMGDVSEYRCFFYRPRSAPALSIDDPRWEAAAARAMGDPDWTRSFPEEAFEMGVAVGPFALELDCPLDPRPVFAHLETLRGHLDGMSDGVTRVLLYAAGVALEFDVGKLTREKLPSDVQNGSEILRVAASLR